MNAEAFPQAEREQIERFVDALFRHADEGSYVSLRAFYDDANEVFSISAARIGSDTAGLVDAAFTLATRAARAPRPVVVAPPIATFANDRGAAEADLQNGLCLSVECDQEPLAARIRLEHLLGLATIVVASGGEWQNPETGEFEPKLHLHWRLTEPTREASTHAKLKRCRAMARDVVGGDGTSTPMVHPMRWPGSLHRKGAPRLCRIVAETENELDLDDAEQRINEAWSVRQTMHSAPAGDAPGAVTHGEPRGSQDLVKAIISGADYHAPLTALAMRYLKGGMPDAQVVLTLRGIMEGVPDHLRDIKDGTPHSGRWQARFDDIPRAVRTARAEIDSEQAAVRSNDMFGPEAIDHFRLDRQTEGDPPPMRFLLRPLVPLGKVGILFGVGGIGKSLIALRLCLYVATRGRYGEAALADFSLIGGFVPLEAAGASVFLTLEDDREEVHRRIASIDPAGHRQDAPCYVIPALDLPNFDPAIVQAEGRLAALTAFAKDGLDQLLTNVAERSGSPVSLLVLDPAGDFLNADENDATYVKVVMRHLRAVAARHGCSIILLGHVSKSMDPDNPTMRGSGAWIANSRFALALFRPPREEADALAKQVGEPAESLVWVNLVKANHAGAPVGKRRLFSRVPSGALVDRTSYLASEAPGEEELLKQLVDACAECAVAGLPYTVTGIAGLHSGRADLPEPLATMSKHALEALGNKALARHLLVKARTADTQSTTKFLDVPDGPLALGQEVPLFHGSRREALDRYRARRGD